MKRALRRKERGLEETAALQLLQTAEYGVLSTCGSNGVPYGVPISYCVFGDAIYFHCAIEGRKIDNIDSNSSVSFCVVGGTEVLPEQFATRYESVIASGNAAEVFDDEKQRALEGLVAKYSPEYVSEGLKYIEAMEQRTRVFRIDIDSICGKARR